MIRKIKLIHLLLFSFIMTTVAMIGIIVGAIKILKKTDIFTAIPRTAAYQYVPGGMKLLFT